MLIAQKGDTPLDPQLQRSKSPRSTFSLTPVFSLSCIYFAIFLILFAVHRAFVFEALLGAGPASRVSPLKVFVVGMMSDFWVAVVLGVIFGAFTIGIAWCSGSSRVASFVFYGMTGLMGLLAAAHTNYVYFFKFPIIPFHLRYLMDQSFLVSNALSFFGVKEAVTLAAPILAGFAFSKSSFLYERSRLRAGVGFALLVLVGLYVHNRNIHFREQWFVPESLQVNPLERIYTQYTSERHTIGVSAKELDQLRELLHRTADVKAKTPWERSLTVLTDLPRSSEQPHSPFLPFAKVLRDVFQRHIQDGHKPIAMVTLLESMRPSETGYFGKTVDSLPSITPEMDALAERAVVFREAYSTGSVTRGGQEAVLCGFLGSRDTSLMRGVAVTSWDCLPRIISEVGVTFWYHGGQGLFDQQEAFWLSQGVKDTMSLKDFPDAAPRSSWGVGDYGFFQATVPRLDRLRREAKGDYLLGMTLSLTNHIPWDLPSDLPPNLPKAAGKGHPSYVTTSYTDYAFGAFVKTLKSTGLWDDLLMVVVSDHGNSVKPYHDLYRGMRNRSARLDSHVQFFLIGGVVEEALAREGIPRMEIDHAVSQADAAVLLADVVGVHNKRFFGTHPLAVSRNQPLIAILEEDLFSPTLGETWSRSKLSQGVFGNRSEESLKAQHYYRAFMDFVGMPSPRM